MAETQAEPGSIPPDEDLAFLGAPTKAGAIGRLGHYEILDVIGKGGFGIVLKGFDERLHRVVAIKVLSPANAANGSARKRFIREAQAFAAIKNEHVVGIYDVQQDANPPYLVMELIDGMSLQDKIDKQGPLGVKEILRIGTQMAEGLAAAHKQGLVHRDIKPANILLENGVERVKITDFGLARAVDDASVTQSGTVAGTPMYMSPEQAEGIPIDSRSDLFSLGTVLYAMCTGHPPFRASGTHAVLRRVIDASPRPIREINSEIPDWLCGIIAKLHAKKPQERIQTANEVAELLGQHLAYLQQPSQVAPPLTTPAPVVNDGHKGDVLIPRRVWWGAGLAAFGAELFVLGMALRESIWDLRITLLMGHALFACVMLALCGLWFAARPAARQGWAHRMAQAAIVCGVLSSACAVALVGISFTGRGVTPPPAESGWVQLFNGKDLTGWKMHPDQSGSWKVEDGLLVGRSMKPSHLFSERGDYENFHLRAQAKISKGGDSGLIFRCEYGLNGEDNKPAPLGYEANIAFLTEFKTGSLWGAGWPPVGPKDSLIAPDTWFTLEVTARDNHILIAVDGKTTVDFLDANDKYRRGHLALQAWAQGTVVCFRKIEIKELPPSTSPNPPSGIDLMPLARPDRKAGTWKREGETLVSIPPAAKNKMRFLSILPIHAELPREFFVEAVIERLAGDDAFTLVIPAFGTDFMVTLDGYPWKGTYSGLSYIGGKIYADNETAVRGGHLVNGKKHTVLVTVRADGVTTSLDGKTLFKYRGGYEKITPKGRVSVGSKFFVEIVDSPYRIHALRLISLDKAPPKEPG